MFIAVCTVVRFYPLDVRILHCLSIYTTYDKLLLNLLTLLISKLHFVNLINGYINVLNSDFIAILIHA